jgi:hypothetical protein
MSPRAKSTFAWWLVFAAAVVLLPVIPVASLLGLGWLLPGLVPWFYADVSVPVGALISVSAATFLLTRTKSSVTLRLVALGVVIFFMSFFARVELVFAQACITQRGSHINFQQQQRDRKVAQGVSCDS